MKEVQMNTGFRQSYPMKEVRMVAHSGRTLSLRLIFSALVAALFLVPGVSQAQTGNTATGTNALNADTTGSYNTADGYYALQATTTGNNNTGSGYQALYANTTGYSNTADGYRDRKS